MRNNCLEDAAEVSQRVLVLYLLLAPVTGDTVTLDRAGVAQQVDSEVVPTFRKEERCQRKNIVL